MPRFTETCGCAGGQGDKKKLELKVRVKAHDAESNEGVAGIEVWKKYKFGKKEVGGKGHGPVCAIADVRCHHKNDPSLRSSLFHPHSSWTHRSVDDGDLHQCGGASCTWAWHDDVI